MGNQIREKIMVKTYIEQAQEFRMSNINPFDKYYKITETRLDGLTVWIQELNNKLKRYLENDPIRNEITELRIYVEKIKELHENIFSEFQNQTKLIEKQAKEMEELWKVVKQLKYQ